LKEKCFRGWPEEPGPLNVSEVYCNNRDNLETRAYDFDSQPNVRLRLYLAHNPGHSGARPPHVFVGLSNQINREALAKWREALPEDFAGVELPAKTEVDGGPVDANAIQVLVLPRGMGRTQWDASEKKQVQNRRRFMLLGQTLAGMQVWDVRRALEAVRTIPACRSATEIKLCGESDMATIALFAAIFEPDGLSLVLDSPSLGNVGPDFLNVLRYLNLPQVAALAAVRCRNVAIYVPDVAAYESTPALVKQFGKGNIKVHERTR
jgi:hypothetical protein